jgi:hypothetical protein
MANHIVIYSHGFGVRKDDRGLFTDIAAGLPNVRHVMFDYNQIDEAKNTLTAAPIGQNVQKLTEVFNRTKQESPTAEINVVAHSQGCIVAALARLPARRTVFLAPPVQTVRAADKFRSYIERYLGVVIKNDIMTMKRRDGSTTIVGQDYWQSYDSLPSIPPLFNAMSNLTIIGALEDEVISQQDYSQISDSVKIIEIHADHNFKNDRQELVEVVKGVLG